MLYSTNFITQESHYWDRHMARRCTRLERISKTLLRKYLEVHGRYKPCQSVRTSPQSVVISGQTDTLANVHKIKWQVLLIAAISVSEVRSEGEPAEKVDEGPGKSR